MTAVEKYNALDGQVVDREDLTGIRILAGEQGQVKIAEKIAKLLDINDDEEFLVKLSSTAIDAVPEECLPGLECQDAEEEFEGLEKAVSLDQIYQMITDKMLEQLKEATGNGYKKKWKKQNDEGYLLPFNFESKKMYRGINIALLTEGMSKVLKNPFFLTFKQIQKFKGRLKQGSKGLPVVYFTMLYSVSETNDKGEKVEFGTYNKKKYLAWLNKNINRLKYSLDYYKSSYIPILKYYNVFNGADVEGIDFDLENFKVGYQDGSEVIKNNDHRVEIADLIVKHYPAPQPKLKDSTDGRAFFRHGYGVDEIHMPKFEDFETGLDYYRTLFHEFTHSTGISSRLDRPMGGKFGSKQYAKEELVAEFGAVFLSAHAGIIWYNQKNHAEYLKNWNSVLTHAKDDNRFFMRAASKAQEAADFILSLDKEGVPKYQHSFKSELKEEVKPAPEKSKKKAAPKKPKKRVSKRKDKNQLELGLAAPRHKGIAKKALSDCGRLKKGYKYAKGGEIVKVAEKKKASRTEPRKRKTPNPKTGKDRLREFQKKDDAIKLTREQRRQARKEWHHLEKPVEWEKFLKAYKPSKKKPSKKKGLRSPVENEPAAVQQPQPEPVVQVPVQIPEPQPIRVPETTKPAPVKHRKVRNMADSGDEKPSVFFNVPGEVGKFLQAVERKPEESVVITLDGQQGAGKTTALYKFMKAFAQGKNRGLFASLEEHLKSALAKEKRDKYLTPEDQQYIDIVSDLDSKEEFYSLIPDYDIIFIDSWQKLLRMIGNIRLDEDLRKKFNGKVFVIIFQQTTDGKTKGGAEVVFDGDIIIKMIKEGKFNENYAYFDKNRYTKVPIEQLRYNIAGGFVYNPEETTDVSDVTFEEIPDNPQIVEPPTTKPTGRLIATPIM